jgi:hypothetical protein
MAGDIVLSPKQVIDLLDRLESSLLSEDDRNVLSKIVRESLGRKVIRVASVKHSKDSDSASSF